MKPTTAMMADITSMIVPSAFSAGSPRAREADIGYITIGLQLPHSRSWGCGKQVDGTKIPIDSPVSLWHLERSRPLVKGCVRRWHGIRKSDRLGTAG